MMLSNYSPSYFSSELTEDEQQYYENLALSPVPSWADSPPQLSASPSQVIAPSFPPKNSFGQEEQALPTPLPLIFSPLPDFR